MMKTNDPMRTAWFPPERSDMIYNRQSAQQLTASNSVGKGLNKTQRIWIIVGVTIGVVAIIAIILGAVLGTQLNKAPEGIPPSLTTSNESQSPTTAPPTTSAPNQPPSSAQVGSLDTEFILQEPFNEKLNDPNSEEYKNLSKIVCDQAKASVPPEQVDSVDCSNITFRAGSTIVTFTITWFFTSTTTTTTSFTNVVQTNIINQLQNGPLKATNVTTKNPRICNPNPCKYSGVCSEGANNEFKCQCKSGKYGKTCDDGPNFCHCSGDPHCKTFDNLAADYQGTCRFIFVQALDKLFTVYLRNINKKEKSTDCDSALIPLFCVHG